MDATREERMQQRLRGSQRRQVKDVDFGLTFPVLDPLSEEPSPPGPSRRSPRLELPTILPTQQTPATQSPPAAQEPAADAVSVALKRRGNNIDANTSAKRRKLETETQLSSGGRSTRSSHPQPIPDISETNEEAQGEAGQEEPQENSVSDVSIDVAADNQASPARVSSPDLGLPESVSRSPIQTPPLMDSTVEEVRESPADAPGSGRRMVTNILTSSSKLQNVQNGSPSPAKLGTTPGSRRKSQGREVAASPSIHEDSFERSNLEIDSSNIDNVESSPIRPKRRTRKHNIVVDIPNEVEKENVIPENEVEDAEAIGDVEAAVMLKKHQGRRRSRSIPTASPDLDETDASQTKPTKTQRKKQPAASPVQQRQPRPHPKVAPGSVAKSGAKGSAKAPKKAIKKSRVRMGSPIPVTVYRLTSKSNYDDDESDYEIPVDKRPDMNSMDVFADLCQEIVSSTLDFLDEGRRNTEDPASRCEYRTKFHAIKAFGEGLDSRLLSHRLNLDNSFSLEKRVREEQRKKLSLRDEIRRARAERQEVALRMDEIRIRHETESKHAQENHELNLAMHDVELAVDNGRTQSDPDENPQMSGIEVLLKRVAGLVSNKGGSGGILEQIKNFNGFLERAASALESRKV